MKTLVAGPDTMEFGWMVATWIPAIRNASRSFEETVVVCNPSHTHLYEFATRIVPYKAKGVADRWLFNDKKVRLPPGLVVPLSTSPEDLMAVSPSKEVCTKWKREYVKYGDAERVEGFELLVHARAETKYKHKKSHRDRNWPIKNYRKVIKSLGGGRVASIGSKKGASHVPGTEDLRGIPLDKLCDILAASRVLLSPSSGPAHLASLCGCPHVVMTYAKREKAIGSNNRKRYEKLWNPFGTPVSVIDKYGWQPPVEAVVRKVEKYL
ncbi:MAG: hypothetical protein GF393_13055 [Armatimonadia bacterium]|nr:hypothetical protein [Armatimonadia bacterium]